MVYSAIKPLSKYHCSANKLIAIIYNFNCTGHTEEISTIAIQNDSQVCKKNTCYTYIMLHVLTNEHCTCTINTVCTVNVLEAERLLTSMLDERRMT